jgi:uncharacterized protein
MSNSSINKKLRDNADQGNLEGVVEALQRGADINAVNSVGVTALHMAAHRGHADIVQLLLKRGADASIVTPRQKETALDYARDGGHSEVVKLLEGS